MEKMANQFKIHNIKSSPKTHFIKLNNIFSIFIFIFLISFSVSICSYTHHFPNFTDSSDRHYIFLLCNGILFFLFMNFNSTHGSSSLKQNQPVITNEIDHPPVLVSSAMDPVAAMEEREEEIQEREKEIQEQEEEIKEGEKEEDDEMERNGNRIYVIEDHNAVSILQIEDQMAEQQQLAVTEEQETGESKEAAETEELNKRCAEFIRNMRERMKCESSYQYGSLQSTKINATISF